MRGADARALHVARIACRVAVAATAESGDVGGAERGGGGAFGACSAAGHVEHTFGTLVQMCQYGLRRTVRVSVALVYLRRRQPLTP